MSHLRRGVPPFDLHGILFKSKACLKDVKGRLDAEEEAMGEKGYYKVLRVQRNGT